VNAVTRLQEVKLAAGSRGDEQGVAPAVGLFQQRQLSAGTGPFAAADHPYRLGPARELVAAGAVAQQAGQLDDTGVIEAACLALCVGDVLPEVPGWNACWRRGSPSSGAATRSSSGTR
jgi:hypothetical protein